MPLDLNSLCLENEIRRHGGGWDTWNTQFDAKYDIEAVKGRENCWW